MEDRSLDQAADGEDQRHEQARPDAGSPGPDPCWRVAALSVIAGRDGGDLLGLTGLVTSMTGLSAVGAAAILAETVDPRRFATARAAVKHAGLAPREKLSGAFTGQTG